MTPNRWQRLKVGDVVCAGSGVAHVVAKVIKRDGKVVEAVAVRTSRLTDPRQWRMMTRDEVGRM